MFNKDSAPDRSPAAARYYLQGPANEHMGFFVVKELKLDVSKPANKNTPPTGVAAHRVVPHSETQHAQPRP